LLRAEAAGLVSERIRISCCASLARISGILLFDMARPPDLPTSAIGMTESWGWGQISEYPGLSRYCLFLYFDAGIVPKTALHIS
jgi:hypothetical protein